MQPNKKAIESATSETMWNAAIRDAEERINGLERQRARLKAAVRLMRRQIKDGVPWPEQVETRGQID